jgi:hypothetical protein
LPAFSVSWSFTQSVRLLGRGISPLQGRYLHRTTQTQRKHTQISMPWVGFEPMILVFERAKIFRALEPNEYKFYICIHMWKKGYDRGPCSTDYEHSLWQERRHVLNIISDPENNCQYKFPIVQALFPTHPVHSFYSVLKSQFRV